MVFSPSAGYIFILLFAAWLVGGHCLIGSGLGVSRPAFKYLQYGGLAIALLIPLLTALLVRSRALKPSFSPRGKTMDYGIWILLGLVSGFFLNGAMWVVFVLVGAFLFARYASHWDRGGADTPGIGKQTVLWLVRAAISLLLFWISFRNRGLPVFDLYDDGPRLAAVNQYMLGGIPHKDFFIHYGLFREVVQPLMAFRMWGVSYESILRLSQGMVALNYAVLFLICTELFESIVFALWVGLILLLRVDLFLPERVFPLLVAVFFLIGAFHKIDTNLWKQKIFLLAGGFLTLGTCLYSLDIGMTLFVGVALALVFGALLGLRDPSSLTVGGYFCKRLVLPPPFPPTPSLR